MVPPDCLTEDTVAELVEGTLDGERLKSAEQHLARCDACIALLAAVGNAMTETAARAASEDDAADDAGEAPLGRDAHVGRYVILEAIGAGAMGRVYAAHDPSLDRKVALKLLHSHIDDPDLETRLLREAKAMARLTHPEVITVHDAGRHGSQLFIAMELVDGGTLRQWVAAAPRSWREILAVYARAGRGLAQAHAAGIVHRDFKPDNVLIGRDGRVRVTDFGLARTGQGDEAAVSRRVLGDASTMDATLTRSGALVGTPAYMAPEQLAGAGADARSDLYGFCVALYEALYGERPFVGKTFVALQAAKLSGDVPAPADERGVPVRLRRALVIGLRPDPADRYPTMNALLDALDRAARASRVPVAIGASLLAIAAVAIALAARSALHPARAVTAAPAPGCTSHRACSEAHQGGPYVCRASDRACVPIASPDCTPMFEPQDLAADDTVWLGAMFPTKGAYAEAFGLMNMEGTDLARSEIASATSALAGTHAAMRVRRIALVGCDDSADPARAARHLVDDVGVPAILGFGSGQEVVDVAGGMLVQRGVVTVATLTSSPLITRIPHPAGGPTMVWRTTFSQDAVAEVTAAMLHDVLEPRARSRDRATRVTLAREDMAGGRSFADVFYQRLSFNGKPAIENGADYQELTFKRGAHARDEIAPLVDAAITRAPTFVVLVGGGLSTVPIVEAIEARWNPASPRPIYVIANDSTAAFAPFIGASAQRRRRVLAIESISSSNANGRFVIAYNATHARQVSRTFNPGNSYDAFYLLAYATFALRETPVTGVALAGAFDRLVPPGRPIEVGPSSVFDALRELADGKRIDLDGTQSGLDFDPATGEAPSDFALLCPGVTPGGRASGEDVESGLVFRASTRTVEGTMRCP